MERLTKYIGRGLAEARLREERTLALLGARARWLPESLEDFDEIDLALPLDGERDLVLYVAVETGKIARIMLGRVPAGDDDADPLPFDEAGLAAVLDEKGDAVVSLLEAIT
jgi:hypothetical protein